MNRLLACHVLSRNYCIEDKNYTRKCTLMRPEQQHCNAPLQCARRQAVMAGVHEIWGTPGAFLGLLFLTPAKELSHAVRFSPRRCFSCKQKAVLQVLWREQQLPVRKFPSCRHLPCHVLACHVHACHVHACHVLACHVHACHVHAYYGRVTIASHYNASVASLLMAFCDRRSNVVRQYAVLIEKKTFAGCLHRLAKLLLNCRESWQLH